jgi:two-component system CheB/CheR fusion protein
MYRPAGERHVVALGGSSAVAASALAGELSRNPELAILVWCPTLTIDSLRVAVPTEVDVIELVDHAELAAGRVYLAPRDRRLAIEGEQLAVGGVDRAPFDAMLRAVADTQTTDAIGIVLYGEDRDGSLGIKRLKESGGLAIVEAPDGEHDELTRASIECGVIDMVLPRAKIAAHVLGLRRIPEPPAEEPDPADTVDTRIEAMRDILTLVRVRSGHDFTGYKRATLFRRIGRRMQVRECDSFEAYHRYLREHQSELGHLLRDFLISVTNFFREPDAFAALANEVIPRFFATKTDRDQIRIWVAGCATGEEAYSLGMLMLEQAARSRSVPQIQIFATDIDERALAEARLGCYSDAIVADVSPERLQRFFTREKDQYRVVKELRELVLFSPHNVLRDPPFSRLDLVSCRNLLIYLDREAQNRAVSTFHFGLRADGVLMLGSSESAESTTLFSVLDPKHRLFSRRAVPASLGDMIMPQTRWQPAVAVPTTYTSPDRSPSLGELHYRVVEIYAPPSVLVNPELNIVHVSEHAGRYLQLAGGEPTRQLLRLVHPGLQLELRAAIYGARQHGQEHKIVNYERDGATEGIELRVHTVDLPELGRGSLLVMFAPVTVDPEVSVDPSLTTVEPVVREMENELHRTRDQLRDTVEQYETSLEELKASNEELQAINEELRSATEELETSKEELQSVNEELTTLNHELKAKVDEVSHANSDLQNLMTSTEIGVIFLDRQLNIKRFTPHAQELFNVITGDIGRPLEHVTHHLLDAGLVDNARTVLSTLRVIERRVAAADGRSFLVRWLPYRSIIDRIEGIVITMVDVTELRDAVAARLRSESALQVAEERLRSALVTAPLTVMIFDASGELDWAFIMGREYVRGQLDLTKLISADEVKTLVQTVRQVAKSHEGTRFELAMHVGGEARVFEQRVEPRREGVTVIGFDVSSLKHAEHVLRDADIRKDEFLATLSHELRNPLAALRIALDVARMGEPDPVELRESLDVMERQVGMLSKLVDELLDLSRITHGKITLEIQVVELARVLEQALESVRASIDDAAQELHVELPISSVRVAGDRMRLVQVFSNLLSNATKYTPELGRIEVTTTVDRDRNIVEVRIADNGNGIAPEELEHIFEIFVQSRDAEGRARGGLGIGLNVVRKIVEMHGGTTHATSAGVGKGSSFTIELPLAR